MISDTLRQQPDVLSPIEQLRMYADNTILRDVVHQVGESRVAKGQIAAAPTYEVGDIEAMTAAMEVALSFRITGKERDEREKLPENKELSDIVYTLADSFGLVGDTEPTIKEATAAVVLGGMAKGCWQRTEYLKELLDKGVLSTDTVVLLGSSRQVDEKKERGIKGLEYVGTAKTEYELMKKAAEAQFGVIFDDDMEGYDDNVPTGFDHGWRIAHATDKDGRNIFVLSAPMLADQFHKNGNRRDRANTLDTWELFARVAQFGSEEHIVAVTNAHFRPFQGADAVNALQKSGASAEVVGFEPAHFGDPPKTTEELLQEMYSAVKSLAKAARS
jgi:hypothetical protein